MLENKADNDFCGYSDMDDLKKHPWAYWDLETLRGNLMTIKSGPGIKKVWPANQYLDLVDEVFPQRVTDVAQAWLSRKLTLRTVWSSLDPILMANVSALVKKNTQRWLIGTSDQKVMSNGVVLLQKKN